MILIRYISLSVLSVFVASFITLNANDSKKFDEIISSSELREGYFNFYWNEGKLSAKKPVGAQGQYGERGCGSR
jgi:hypothetical protein